MDLLRISTAGSVDDGKSTLIGRLLYDTHSILEDQLRALEASSRRRGEPLNLALLTDGLRAEREQGITIDVAYRYFSTSRRAFIIADTPGHAQYTRNMVTGASTAELAIILVDARKGLQTQSRRHGFIAALLGVPHIVLAVNKMDAVDYAQDAFERIAAEYRAFASKLDVRDLTCIPVSALHGDNVARHSPAMPWYDGTTLLHHLEHVHGDATRNKVDFRFAVQQVIRPHQDFRGLAGRVASGSVAPGEEVVVLPAGLHTTVKAIETFDGPREEAAAGDSVVITLNDDVDAGRGDMIVRRLNLPAVGQDLDAMICWMSERPLDVRRRYLITHTTRTAPAFVSRLVYRIDIDTLHRQPAGALALNEIGRVELRASVPLMFDAYQTNRETGSFILIDPDTNETVAAGIVRGPKRTAPMAPPAAVMQPWNVTRDAREARNGHGAICVWLTGLSGSGKSTIARALERRLFEAGIRTALLDGDILRHGLNRDLAFAAQDRRENIRRAGEVARLFFEHGDVVICTFISPFAEDRARVRALFPKGCFIEVHVDAEVDECERRDPKGLYARARAGAIPEFTGISSPYEPPEHPDMRIDTMAESSEQAAARVAEVVRERIARD